MIFQNQCFAGKKRPTLSKKVVLWLNLVLVVILGLFMILDSHIEWKVHIEEKTTQLSEEGEILIASLSHLRGQERSFIQGMIDQACSAMQESVSPGHHIAALIDTETFQANAHHRASPAILSAMIEGAGNKDCVARVGENKIIVGSAEEENITVYVSEYLSNIRGAIGAQIIRRITAIALAGLILAVLLNVMLHRLMVTPIKEMVNTVQEFGRGNLGTRMKNAPTKEIGFLVEEFNQMAGEVENSERQLNSLAQMLESKNKELKNFAYITSHDLRAPLINVQGFSGELAISCSKLQRLIEEATTDADAIKQEVMPLVSEEIPESLSFINAGVGKMQRLLDGLLTVSRVDSVNLDITTVNMTEVADQIVDFMRYQIRTNEVSVAVDNLPDCLGDEDQINQVFSNILSNALKYRSPDRKGTIHISGCVQKGLSVYSIEDNGIGIAPEHQEKVFEVFRRINPSGTESGEGLGLAIVRRILDRHDGKIWLKSQVGKGTTFFVALPSVSNNLSRE